jgi:dephospho-CoA kinase
MNINSTSSYSPNFEAYKLGVTGNIASGKSTVQRYFENQRIKCIDVDDVCHKLYESDKNVIEKVKAMFGSFGFHELDNDDFIDRSKIRTFVFKNPEIKKALEEIVHPAVEKYVDNFVKENKEEKYVAIFNPLLFETGKQKDYDKVLFIKIGPQLQLKRLLARNPFLTEETAKDRINSQMDQRIKAKKADFIIDNSFGADITIDQVENLIDTLEHHYAWEKQSLVEKIDDAIRKYFIGYPKRIKYTWEHKKAYLAVEKKLTGKNTLRGYLHDLDKLIMYAIGVPKEIAHNIHINTAPHHIRKNKVKYPKGAVIDWECARYTKPDKPLNARDFYERSCPQMPEIEKVLDDLNLERKITD